MTISVQSLTSGASYQALKSLDTELAGVSPPQRGRLIDALAESFHLITPPSAGTRRLAALARLPLVGCLVPGGSVARRVCEIHDERQRNVRELLTGQRALLMSEYGGPDGIRRVLSAAGIQELPHLLRDRVVEDFHQLDRAFSAVQELRVISSAVQQFETAARNVHDALRSHAARYGAMVEDREVVYRYAYAAMNAALDQRVTAHLADLHSPDLIGQGASLEIRPALRRELMAAFQAEVATVFAGARGVGISPRHIDGILQELLRTRNLLAPGDSVIAGGEAPQRAPAVPGSAVPPTADDFLTRS